MILQDTDNNQELQSDSTKSTFISNSQADYNWNTGLEAAGVLLKLTHKATSGHLGKIKIRTEVICCTEKGRADLSWHSPTTALIVTNRRLLNWLKKMHWIAAQLVK